jgi:hypothetical protein
MRKKNLKRLIDQLYESGNKLILRVTELEVNGRTLAEQCASERKVQADLIRRINDMERAELGFRVAALEAARAG